MRWDRQRSGWMEALIVTQHSSYLLGSESWNQLGYIVPVYGLWHSPQRAQHHVQHQDVVVVRKVVVVRAEAAHLYRDRRRQTRGSESTMNAKLELKQLSQFIERQKTDLQLF